jgi:hypothetical protein
MGATTAIPLLKVCRKGEGEKTKGKGEGEEEEGEGEGEWEGEGEGEGEGEFLHPLRHKVFQYSLERSYF